MGLIQRHITEDFINHVLYGDFLLNDDAMFKGETMNETLVFQYVYEMSKYYESEKISDIVKERALHGDVFKIRLSIKHHTTGESERHYLTLGLKKLVCVAADYGIKVRDYELKAFKDIDVTGEGCLYDFISDYYKKNGLVPETGDNISSGESWNEDDIKKALEKHEVFKSKNGTYIPYAMLYNPMSENHLINEHCSEALFCYCIDIALSLSIVNAICTLFGINLAFVNSLTIYLKPFTHT